MFSRLFLLSGIILGVTFEHATSLHGRCDYDDGCVGLGSHYRWPRVDSYCNNGTFVCKPGFAYHDEACIQVVDPRMGCMSNSDCQPPLGDRSICKNASCACLPNHHLHNMICIQNRGLYERCDADFECYLGEDMMEQMGCISGECICKSEYTRMYHHGGCVVNIASDLYEREGLDYHDGCNVIDSYCNNNNTCVCKPSFAYHDEACIQVIDPRMGCMSNSDCQPILGDRSICKNASCACLPNHHLHNMTCIKNRGLKDRCDADFECYWGEDMMERMGCISGKCTCIWGYAPLHHRCYSDASHNIALSTVSTLVLMLLNKMM